MAHRAVSVRPLCVCPASSPHYSSSICTRVLECKQQKTSLSNLSRKGFFWKEMGDLRDRPEAGGPEGWQEASPMHFFSKWKELVQTPRLWQEPGSGITTAVFISAKLTPCGACACMCVIFRFNWELEQGGGQSLTLPVTDLVPLSSKFTPF